MKEGEASSKEEGDCDSTLSSLLTFMSGCVLCLLLSPSNYYHTGPRPPPESVQKTNSGAAGWVQREHHGPTLSSITPSRRAPQRITEYTLVASYIYCACAVFI